MEDVAAQKTAKSWVFLTMIDGVLDANWPAAEDLKSSFDQKPEGCDDANNGALMMMSQGMGRGAPLPVRADAGPLQFVAPSSIPSVQ